MHDEIRAFRESHGWTQGDLAARAGVTRQLVSALEAGRHIPNVVAAIGIASALGISVEQLFGTRQCLPIDPFGTILASGTPLTTATVGEAIVAVPLQHGVANCESWGIADAIAEPKGVSWLPDGSTDGLVIAGCDPVLGMIAGLVERSSKHRILTVHASTSRSLRALAAGRVHGALVHASAADFPEPPDQVTRWHVTRWQVGLASSQRGGPPTVEELVERRQRVVQRESGAGSQRAFVRALRAVGAGDQLPGPVGEGHVDVARRVAQGNGHAGVTMEAAALAFGLGFSPLEEHSVELWVDSQWTSLRAVAAMIDVLSGSALACRVANLGGYDVMDCGTERRAS